VNFEDVPKQLINAFLASEDDGFFEHPGVDFKGLIRASLQLALTGKKKQGGSTITMQVAVTFCLAARRPTHANSRKSCWRWKWNASIPKIRFLNFI